jgi:transcriptional regulator with XRE-family HTH domain
MKITGDTLGERLRLLRVLVDKTQETFGQVAGVGGSMVSRYEKNQRRPFPEYFIRIRKRTGVDLNWLLCGDGEMFPAVPVDIEQKLKIVREIMHSIKKIRQLLIELMKH